MKTNKQLVGILYSKVLNNYEGQGLCNEIETLWGQERLNYLSYILEKL